MICMRLFPIFVCMSTQSFKLFLSMTLILEQDKVHELRDDDGVLLVRVPTTLVERMALRYGNL